MKQEKTSQDTKRESRRQNERGAALVMVLMIAFLLLVASAALLLESSMNTANVTDSVAEQQAYYAAESGIQSALDVLRGNTSVIEPIAAVGEPAASQSDGKSDWAWLNPLRLIETTASAQATPTPTPNPIANKIDFRKAVTPSTSNKSNDTSNSARLSRWLNYNYTPSGQSVPDRVTIGKGTYNPHTGMAFSLAVTDPDKIGNVITYNTTGRIEKPDGTLDSTSTFTSGGNSVTFTYVPDSSTPKSVTINSGTADTKLGTFQMSYSGNTNGMTLPDALRFEIVFNMISPYQATQVIRGAILPNGTIKAGSTGVTVLYDSQVFTTMGSWITLKNVSYVNQTSPVAKIGYEMTPTAPPNSTNTAGETAINVSMTPPEPTRLVVRATGYGPRGALKELETIVQKNFFNGLGAPATLTLIGPKTKTGSPNFMFEPGNSQNVTYSGDDVVSNLVIPSIGTTANDNLTTVENLVLCGKRCKTDIAGFPANVTEDMPFWLQNTKNLDDTIENLKLVALSSGRFYAAGETPPNFGDNANARGITFVDGDVSLSGAGGGILVCTGKLTLHGGFDFNGLIIVTGAQGVRRSGAGNGEIHGNMVVAPYNKNDLVGGFLPPQFDTRGGGNSEMRYNSSSVANGMLAVSNFVRGVAEK